MDYSPNFITISYRPNNHEIDSTEPFRGESLLHRACDAPAAQAARKAALETEESQLFHLQPSGPDTVPFIGLCLPLPARNQLVGVLEAYSLEHCTGMETVQSLESLATQGARALENARLPRITTL